MRPLCLILVAASLGACSTYKGVKLGSDARIAPGEGVPVTLSRPEFTVKKIEGSDPEQYQVSVTYVPDPDQRYAVRLSPALLSNVEFAFAFNEAGGLTSSNASVKDQIVPTTLALFKVAASAAVAAGTGLPLSLGSPTGLADCLDKSQVPAMAKRTQCVFTFVARTSASPCAQTAASENGISARMARYADPDGKDTGEPLKTLFARDAVERSCLSDATAALAALDANDPKLKSGDLANDFKNALAAEAGTGDGAMVQSVLVALSDAVTKAIEGGDVPMVKRLAYLATMPQGAPDALSKQLKAGTLLAAGDPARLSRALVAAKLDPQNITDHSGLERVARIGEAKRLRTAFNEALDLQPAAWRARYITAVQKSIEIAEREALTANPASNARLDPKVLRLREQLAALAGVRADYDRLLGFERLLDRMPGTLSTGQRLSPVAEYQSIRAQAAGLEQAIAAAVAARLVMDSKKKADVLPPRSPWIDAACIKAAQEEAWRYRNGTDAAPFVVVLRRVDGTALTPLKANSICAD